MVNTPLGHYLSLHTLPLPAAHGEIGNGHWTLAWACRVNCSPLEWCDFVSHKGQAMIAQAGLESRIANLLTRFASAKEGLESEIHALDDVLQDLGSSGYTSLHAGSSAHW